MRSLISIIGVILIILGIISLAYTGFTYTSKEKVAEIGNVEISQQTQKTVYLSPVLGGLSLVAGIVLVVVSRPRP